MYDAIVLAGGAGRRMHGVDKPGLQVGGVSLLDRVLAAVADAQQVIVVGPSRVVHREVIWRREEPAGGGPVAAIAAGLDAVRADVVLVLAADLPEIAPAIPELVRALAGSSAGAACLVDDAGRLNYLAAAWRTAALRDAVAAVEDVSGAPARSLVSSGEIIAVPDPGGWGRDCDTWDELAEARRRART